MAVDASQGQLELGGTYPPFMPSLHERLQALHDDSRAGFIPTTHDEKNTALVLLDYLEPEDDEEAELHVPDLEQWKRQPAAAYHLIEIFRRQVGLHTNPLREQADGGRIPDELYRPARLDGEKAGQAAVRSKTLEMGDFLLNAARSHHDLWQLDKDLRELMNPHVSLAEEFEEDQTGLHALFRFIDQNFVQRSGHLTQLGFDPFRTVVFGRGDPNLTPPRHKFIQDVYTGSDVSPAVAQRIAYLGRTMTVGQLRSKLNGGRTLLDQALTDQRKRVSFWADRLREVRAHVVARPLVQEILAEAQIAH